MERDDKMKLQHRMEYVKLFWKHDYPDDPVVIIYEADLDDERYAVRLIDIFADGHTSNQEDKAWGYVTELPYRLWKYLIQPTMVKNLTPA